MIVADLFCGAGGWHVALDQLGLPHQGFDSDADAVNTYRAAGGDAVQADLTRCQAQHPRGVVASPPCQPYSAAGRRQGRTDSRSRLALLVPHWCHDAQWVAMEQVTGAGSVFARVAALLQVQGFHVARHTLHSEQYGVPQTRTRLVLMAHRDGLPPVPTPTHSRYYPHRPWHHDKGLPEPLTMAQALGWGVDRPYPTVAAGTAGGGADTQMVGGSGGRAALRAVNDRPHAAVRTLDTPAPAMAFGHETPRWVFERPATTVVGSFQPQVVAAPDFRTDHPRQNADGSVNVTVSQAGVLQGFPFDHPWTGSRTSRYQQVGNAIPPPLAYAVIKTLMEM